MNRNGKKRRQLRFLLLFSLLVLYLLLLPLSLCLDTRSRIVKPDEVPKGKYPVAVVLGCGIRNGEPSAMLAERLRAALTLFREGKVETLLLSGYREDDDYDEVAVMKRFLTEAGVPEKALLLDPYGLSTSDSMKRAKELYGVDSAVIVTQRYHLCRSLFLADAAGIRALGADAAEKRFFGQGYRNAREFLAIHKDFLKTVFLWKG